MLHCDQVGDAHGADFGGDDRLVGEAVRSLACEASANAGGDHASLVSGDVEAVGRSRCLVEGDAEGFRVAGDGVSDPSAVVVGEGGAVGGEHEAVVGVSSQVPDGSPPGCPSALSVPWGHGEHDLDAFSGGYALEGAVDEVEVRCLHFLSSGEHRGEGSW